MKVRALLLASALTVMGVAPACAEDGWGDGIAVMEAEELQDHRGGFAVGNLNFNFGATVTTLVNGAPALVTTLTWTDTGTFVEQTVGQVGADLSAMSPAELAALGLTSGDGVGGVVITDESGVTALVHNVTAGSLQNIIVNNATGRDLSQNIDVTLELSGFELIQSQLALELFGMHLTDDLRLVVGGD